MAVEITHRQAVTAAVASGLEPKELLRMIKKKKGHA